MTEIKRYHVGEDEDYPVESTLGMWCKWEDVEKLQKAFKELTTKALAAVWLIPEDKGAAELRELREEARSVFDGKDKQIIAKLQGELRNAQDHVRQLRRPPIIPGVNNVYGVKLGEEKKIRYALMLTEVHHGPNGGLEIEVMLP